MRKVSGLERETEMNQAAPVPKLLQPHLKFVRRTGGGEQKKGCELGDFHDAGLLYRPGSGLQSWALCGAAI